MSAVVATRQKTGLYQLHCSPKVNQPKIEWLKASETSLHIAADNFVAYLLRLMLNVSSSGVSKSLTVFNSFLPSISIHDYITRLKKYMSCSESCFILAGVYISRYLDASRLALTPANVNRLALVALVTGAKYLDDAFLTNSYYAQIGGVSLHSLNTMEKAFLSKLSFNLFVTAKDFEKQKFSHLDSMQQLHDTPLMAKDVHHQAQQVQHRQVNLGQMMRTQATSTTKKEVSFLFSSTSSMPLASQLHQHNPSTFDDSRHQSQQTSPQSQYSYKSECSFSTVASSNEISPVVNRQKPVAEKFNPTIHIQQKTFHQTL